MLKVGVGRQDMTPPVGIPHTLWGARTRETADRIHIPLNATALCLDNDGTRVLIPYRILIGTQVGDLVIISRDFTVSATERQASAN